MHPRQEIKFLLYLHARQPAHTCVACLPLGGAGGESFALKFCLKIKPGAYTKTFRAFAALAQAVPLGHSWPWLATLAALRCKLRASNPSHFWVLHKQSFTLLFAPKAILHTPGYFEPNPSHFCVLRTQSFTLLGTSNSILHTAKAFCPADGLHAGTFGEAGASPRDDTGQGGEV